MAHQFFEDSKGRKKKGKLSQEEIKALSTDELLSYIENEGKKIQENDPEEDSSQTVHEESKSMQQMRAKAKAFVKMKQEQMKSDPSCKFCNGSITASKFVHEKFCVLAPEAKKSKNCDSTQASSTPLDEMDEEDLQVEQFARNLEMI